MGVLNLKFCADDFFLNFWRVAKISHNEYKDVLLNEKCILTLSIFVILISLETASMPKSEKRSFSEFFSN